MLPWKLIIIALKIIFDLGKVDHVEFNPLMQLRQKTSSECEAPSENGYSTMSTSRFKGYNETVRPDDKAKCAQLMSK